MERRVQCLLSAFAGDVIGLLICGAFVPGVTLTASGLVIAVLVLSVPMMVLEPVIDRAAGSRREPPGDTLRFLGSFSAAFVWIPVGPAVADWVAPGFNIETGWAYLVVVIVTTLTHGVIGPTAEWLGDVRRERG